MTNSIAELEGADCIFVIGSNTTEAHPIVALRIKAAVTKHGANLIVADPRRIELTRFASLHLRQRCGSDIMLLNAIMNAIVNEGLHNKAFIAGRTEGFDEFWQVAQAITPEVAQVATGVPADDIRRAARMLGTAKNPSIVYAMGITQHITGTDNVKALANLAMLIGGIGRPSTGVNPLRGQNNVQGACDMGGLPNVLPGYQRVDAPEVREKFAKAWGAPIPEKPGLTVVEIIQAIEAGRIKALYCMGENPVLSDPNSNHVREALQRLELLIVQDIFLTETAEYAHVVFPSASFAEKDGTFTNTERRVQRVRKAIEPPGQARQDWEIICDLAARLGGVAASVPLAGSFDDRDGSRHVHRMHYDSPSQIMAEIASLTPSYGGISYERLEKGGLQWPCPTPDHPGTPFLHKDRFSRGLGRFHATPFREPAEQPDADYPFVLSTGRVLYHFHTATMTRQVAGLHELYPGGDIQVNPDDAAALGLEQGEPVEVASRRGAITAKVLITDRVPRGTVFMPFHFREAPANVLTIDVLDPVAKIPELKVCAVRLRKVPQPAEAAMA